MKSFISLPNAVTYSVLDKTKYETYVRNQSDPKIQKLVNDPTHLFWDIKTKKPALCVEDFYKDKLVINHLPTETVNVLKQTLNPKNYILSQKETIIEVITVNGHNSSFLMLNDMNMLISKFVDITSDISVLISDRINLPIYFGHTSALERLAENSDYKYVIIKLEEVKKYV